MPELFPAESFGFKHLPFLWQRQASRSESFDKYVYGAASLSDGEGDGLFILWGVWFSGINFPSSKSMDWRLDMALPFCEVYQL